jgi:hypothetical protein
VCLIIIIMSTTSAERALLASAVSIPGYLKKWQKLDHSDPLAQLHSKFWGKVMAKDSEEEARRVERQSTHNLREIGDDGDESKGNEPVGAGKSKGDGADEREDGGADESEDDDKHGYILGINNNLISMKNILVRVSVFTLGEMSSRTW